MGDAAMSDPGARRGPTWGPGMLRRGWGIGILLLAVAGAPLVTAAPTGAPQPLPGVLVLAGPGQVPDEARQQFLQLAGRRLVVIDAHGSSSSLWSDLPPGSVTRLEVPDRAAAQDSVRLAPLVEATGVWLAGERLELHRGSRLDAGVRAVLERGGAVGGHGAGAAALAERFMPRPGGKSVRGYGLLPDVVLSAGEPPPGKVGLELPADTAVIARGRLLRVVGKEPVTVSWAASGARPAHRDEVKPGDALDLFQLRRAAAFRVLRSPFPARRAAVPRVPRGSLVIVGGGGTTPEIMDRFFQLAGGRDALVVVIPTAGDDGPVPPDPADARYLRRWGATNVRVLHTRDRAEANDPDFSRILLEAKGVWFGGGRQWRFIDAYEGTLVERRFRQVLERGGVIGGSSAGASIQSEYMPRGHPLGNTVMAAEGYERGFGYLPGCAVDQHFFARNRRSDMTGLMKQYPQLLGIGIDEATAIVVQGHTAEVVGRSKVAFYDYRGGPPQGEKDYTEVPAGGRYDLKERKALP